MATDVGTFSVVEVARVRALIQSGEARAIRETAGISQSEMARDLDISAEALSRWETGHRLPRAAVAMRYGRLLQALQGR